MRRTTLTLAALFLIAGADAAEEPGLAGYWRAQDEVGKTTSIIELFLRDDRLHARIVKTLDGQGNEIDPICERCPDDLKGKPTKGMVFARDLRRDGDHWSGGKVMDLRAGPTQGFVASCDLRLTDGKAVLHGYLGLRAFGQSSTWTRSAYSPPSAAATSPAIAAQRPARSVLSE